MMETMEIRLANPKDQAAVLALYQKAKQFMHSHGNPSQWKDDGFPNAISFNEDIAAKAAYVVVEEGEIVGTFALYHDDTNYPAIRGRWLNDEPYVVVHRLASGQPGVGTFILQEVLAKHRNVRIDTHKDNLPMKRLLAKLGFVYCGTVPLLNYDQSIREAYMAISRPSSL